MIGYSNGHWLWKLELCIAAWVSNGLNAVADLGDPGARAPFKTFKKLNSLIFIKFLLNAYIHHVCIYDTCIHTYTNTYTLNIVCMDTYMHRPAY